MWYIPTHCSLYNSSMLPHMTVYSTIYIRYNAYLYFLFKIDTKIECDPFEYSPWSCFGLCYTLVKTNSMTFINLGNLCKKWWYVPKILLFFLKKKKTSVGGTDTLHLNYMVWTKQTWKYAVRKWYLMVSLNDTLRIFYSAYIFKFNLWNNINAIINAHDLDNQIDQSKKHEFQRTYVKLLLEPMRRLSKNVYWALFFKNKVNY